PRAMARRAAIQPPPMPITAPSITSRARRCSRRQGSAATARRRAGKKGAGRLRRPARAPPMPCPSPRAIRQEGGAIGGDGGVQGLGA
ncbi:hypothetical protein HMPREF0731_2819, partial [Pseudoroseomonas cervicalis ATCC 49957]